VIHWYKQDDAWVVEKIIDVENEKHPDWPIPVPGLISVILLSMDDRPGLDGRAAGQGARRERS
jgi:selenium-binding protein 1